LYGIILGIAFYVIEHCGKVIEESGVLEGIVKKYNLLLTTGGGIDVT
jgi:hypothetical protein